MIAALINHLWQSTLFCGGAWLITLALRANSASLRHWIWLLASLKFLVPFALLFLMGSFIGLPAARSADIQPLVFGDALQSASVLVSPGALRAIEAGAFGSRCWCCWRSGWAARSSSARAGCSGGWLLIHWSGQRGRRRAHYRMHASRMPTSNRPWRVFHPVVLLPAALLGRLSERRWTRCSRTSTNTSRAATISRPAFTAWSRRCSGFTPRSGG